MMEERYHVTTQNRFYADMSNVLVNKKYYSGGRTYQPTYVACNKYSTSVDIDLSIQYTTVYL